jgi:hypothetical protein
VLKRLRLCSFAQKQASPTKNAAGVQAAIGRGNELGFGALKADVHAER